MACDGHRKKHNDVPQAGIAWPRFEIDVTMAGMAPSRIAANPTMHWAVTMTGRVCLWVATAGVYMALTLYSHSAVSAANAHAHTHTRSCEREQRTVTHHTRQFANRTAVVRRFAVASDCKSDQVA